jgi:hypothetical protein
VLVEVIELEHDEGILTLHLDRFLDAELTTSILSFTPPLAGRIDRRDPYRPRTYSSKTGLA